MGAARQLVISERAAEAVFDLAPADRDRAMTLLAFLRDDPAPGGSKRPAPFPHQPGSFVLLSGDLVIVYRFDDALVEVITVRRSVAIRQD